MTDSIMQDVWKAKDEIAMECGYNLKKLAEVLKIQQASSHTKIIDYHHRTIASTLKKMLRIFSVMQIV